VQRYPRARKLVESLAAEHKEGAKLIRELERRLMFFEEGWPEGAGEFLGAVNAYADFHWKHMRKEETELLPLAEQHLLPEDWRAIARAFQANEDPIAQIEERDFQKLFSRIANLAPAPVGLGEAWKPVAN
jgi:hemerythrin-like domain-containing protein